MKGNLSYGPAKNKRLLVTLPQALVDQLDRSSKLLNLTKKSTHHLV